jgi:signal transduction histidine kinase
VRSHAAAITDGVDRALELTDRLLAFSTTQTSEPRHLDLRRAVESFARTVEPLLRDEIGVALDLPAGAVHVHADPVELDRLLLNLTLNARQAMEHGGTLTLTVREATRPGGDDAVYAVVGVADTGAGMVESVRLRVFEPFFTTRGDSGGTGIGLATVHEIARGRGGHVDVASEPGSGTRFDVYLPVAAAQGARSSTSQSSAIG